jgi:hypothetical protein
MEHNDVMALVEMTATHTATGQIHRDTFNVRVAEGRALERLTATDPIAAGYGDWAVELRFVVLKEWCEFPEAVLGYDDEQDDR